MVSRILGKTRTAALVTVALTALAGCGSSDAGSSSTAGSSDNAAADLAVAGSALGRIVVDGKKMTAYYFTKDTPNSGKSACAGPCLQAWPPITTTSSSPTVSGVTGQVGTITLADGSRQLTVNGRPLYLFAKDSKAGDVLGQGVGGVWYVVRPDGTMVTDKPSSGPATPAY
jgi:predicted lipoprotein with Yx(FWY)xxD motif